MSLVVATLSGCGEDAKDCGGFFDKTFGREECAVALPILNRVPGVTGLYFFKAIFQIKLC